MTWSWPKTRFYTWKFEKKRDSIFNNKHESFSVSVKLWWTPNYVSSFVSSISISYNVSISRKSGGETDYTVPVKSKELVIHCKAGSHSQGSSKVKLINRIDYNWEVRFYQGQLVAVHIDGKVVAFAMKGNVYYSGWCYN